MGDGQLAAQQRGDCFFCIGTHHSRHSPAIYTKDGKEKDRHTAQGSRHKAKEKQIDLKNGLTAHGLRHKAKELKIRFDIR